MAAKEVICPNCHQPTSAKGAFCGNCGAALNPANATATAATTPAQAPSAPAAPTPPAAPTVPPQPAVTQPTGTAVPVPVDQLNIPSMDTIKQVKTTSWVMIILGGANIIYGLYVLTMPQSYISRFEPNSGLNPSDIQIIGGIQAIIGIALVTLTIFLMRSKSPKRAKSLLIALIAISVILILLSLLGGSIHFLGVIALILGIRAMIIVKKMPQV